MRSSGYQSNQLCGIQPGRRVHLRARVKTWQESSSQYGDFLFLFPPNSVVCIKITCKKPFSRGTTHPTLMPVFLYSQFILVVFPLTTNLVMSFILSHFNYFLFYPGNLGDKVTFLLKERYSGSLGFSPKSVSGPIYSFIPCFQLALILPAFKANPNYKC